MEKIKKKPYEYKKRKGFRLVHIDNEQYHFSISGLSLIVYEPSGLKWVLDISEFYTSDVVRIIQQQLNRKGYLKVLKEKAQMKKIRKQLDKI